MAAVESISTLFCDSLEPLYGLGILRSSLSTYLGSTVASNTEKVQSPSYGLGMRMMGKFFEKLPGEILEEEVPKAKGLIMKVCRSPFSVLRCILIGRLICAGTQRYGIRRAEKNSFGSDRFCPNGLAKRNETFRID